MPAYYSVVPGAIQTTNATPNTENDSLFVSPGTLAQCIVRYIHIMGKAGGATTLSALTGRLKGFPTTASSGGTAITPSPTPTATAAAKSSAGYATGAVTSGTGTLVFYREVSCGVSGSDTWMASRDLDDVPQLQPSATKSLDMFVSCASASTTYGLDVGIAE
jgi:hypothetical protein